MAQNEVRYKFTAEDSQFKKVAGNVGSEIKKMAKDGSLGVAALGTAFAYLGTQMKDTLDTMDKISKMSSKTGFSTESLSALKYAAELSDVSLETLEKSFIKLSKSVDGNSPAFQKLNINLKDSNGTLKSNETILMDVADAFAGMEDGATKTALATEIFGKAGADMIPLLNGGSEAIRAQMIEAENLGITFDSVSAKKAERFNDSLTTLTNAAKGFTQELVLALMPAIDDLSGGMETASGKSTSLKDKLTPLQAIARGIAVGFMLVVEAVKLMGYHFGFMIAIVWDLISAIGTMGKALFYAITGQFEKAALETSKVFDDPFNKIKSMFSKLDEELRQFKNQLVNTALGTTSYGMDSFTWTTGGTATENEKTTTTPTPNAGAKKEAIDELKLFEEAKKDALEQIEKDWSKWQVENENATLLQRLQQYRDYLERKRTYMSQYSNSEQFGQLDSSQQNSTYNEILKNNEELKNLTNEFKKYNDNIFGRTLLGGFGSQDDLSKIFGIPADVINKVHEIQLKNKADNFIKSAQMQRDENPKYELSIFDALANQQKSNFSKYTKAMESLGTDWLKLEGELNAEKQRLLDSGLSPDNSAILSIDKLKADSYKSYLETKLLYDENYANASKDIEQQTQDAKIGIISNALSSIGQLFAKHTLAYKAFAIAQVIMDTYTAATKALLLLPPWGEIQAAAVIASGLANVATIASVEVPAYAKGGLVSKPTLGLVGEAGAEIIAPQRDFMSYSKQLINQVTNYNANQGGLIGHLKIKGNDLIVAVERNTQLQGRLGI
ncbi:MAG: hypothetical protein LCH52_03765 [Bacteroidetes bacterium]|nr:hypothetical protein [Bacteroidota bacterium]